MSFPRLVWAAAVMVGCAACSSTVSGEGNAVPGSGTAARDFNPCSDVTTDLVKFIGFDDTTRKPYQNGGGRVTESGCSWDNIVAVPTKTLDIGHGSSVLEDYARNPLYVENERISIGDRPAIRFRTDTITGACVVAIQLPKGSAVVASASFSRSTAPPPDACPDAIRISQAILPILP